MTESGGVAMNLDDYERSEFSRYQAFSDTVRHILENAILAEDGLPRPQSIQARAKTPGSLRKRLQEAGNLDALEIASLRRDLAGVSYWGIAFRQCPGSTS